MSTEVRKLDLYKKTSDIFERYKDTDRAVFLDSSLKNQLGRYSIVGLHPYLEVKEEQGKCYVNGEEQEISVENYIEQYLLEHKEENPWNLPMIAGAVGYFSYDFGRKFEKNPDTPRKESGDSGSIICFL